MTDGIRVFAGECTTDFEGSREQIRRGTVVVMIKPDNTVLVHDIDGYQPIAWLTRPESISIDRLNGTIEACDDDQRLRVRFHEMYGDATYPGSVAGMPVGTCPDTDGALVRARGMVVNLASGDHYGLPSGAVVLGEQCDDCGLPLIRVERGARFEVCLDRTCESLDEAVTSAFDHAWSCPNCGDALRVLRRNSLMIGCDSYPDCETGFALPDGIIVGMCECGLPEFGTKHDTRCLDSGCVYD
jgi:DNA topoisomerase-1